MSDKIKDLAEAYATKRCEVIRKRRELGMQPYLIHEAIMEDYLVGYEQGQKDARRKLGEDIFNAVKAKVPDLHCGDKYLSELALIIANLTEAPQGGE